MKTPTILQTTPITIKGAHGGVSGYLSGIGLLILLKYGDYINGLLFYVIIAILLALALYQLPGAFSRKPSLEFNQTGIKIDGFELIPWSSIEVFHLIQDADSVTNYGKFPDIRLAFKDETAIPRPQPLRRYFFLPVTRGTKALIIHLNQVNITKQSHRAIENIAQEYRKSITT